MNKQEFLINLGYALSNAEVTESLWDSCGNGEVTLQAASPLSLEIRFGYQEGESDVTLLYCDFDSYICVDGCNVNPDFFNDVDWSEVLDGRILDIMETECQSHSDGPYYDFWAEEYETEEDDSEAA